MSILILKAARELLSDPAKWTKGAGARDADGNPVGDRYRGAICWCLDGALRRHRFKFDPSGEDYTRALRALGKIARSRSNHTGIVAFNDNPKTTHADVLSLLDEAIACSTIV